MDVRRKKFLTFLTRNNSTIQLKLTSKDRHFVRVVDVVLVIFMSTKNKF